MGKPIAILVLILTTGLVAYSQDGKSSQTEPKTKLESFQAKTGTVLIKGYTEVGQMSGVGGTVTVNSMEFVDAQSSKKIQGVLIEVKESGRLERENRAFIDSDEVDSLLKGVEYISKIDKDVTTLKNFEASYKTKGDFAVTTFNSSSGLGVAVSVGNIGAINVFFKMSDLERFKELLSSAKGLLQTTQK